MRLRTTWSALLAALTAVGIVVGCGGSDDIESADVVLRGGKIVTMDGQRTIAQAVAVREGRIDYVGSDAGAALRIGVNTQVIELGGRMLMPGFVDAHLHALAGGRALLLCDLAYQPLTRAQLATRLQACLDALDKYIPDAVATRPDGGFFLSLTLPSGTSTTDLRAAASKRNLNLADGLAFFPQGGGERFLRLPFCALSPAQIDAGIARLAEAVKDVRK